MSFSIEMKQAVWEKGFPIEAINPDVFRLDD